MEYAKLTKVNRQLNSDIDSVQEAYHRALRQVVDLEEQVDTWHDAAEKLEERNKALATQASDLEKERDDARKCCETYIQIIEGLVETCKKVSTELDLQAPGCASNLTMWVRKDLESVENRLHALTKWGP